MSSSCSDRAVPLTIDPNDLDEVIHGRVRLSIMAYLSAAGGSDFLALLQATGTTKGNLSAHLGKLERAGYVSIAKGYVGKVPRTSVALTGRGAEAFEGYLDRMQQFISESMSQAN